MSYRTSWSIDDRCYSDELMQNWELAKAGQLLSGIAQMNEKHVTMGYTQTALFERAAERGIVGNVHAPSRRVAALDAFLRRRAQELASTTVVDREELKHQLDDAMKRRPEPTDGTFRVTTGT